MEVGGGGDRGERKIAYRKDNVCQILAIFKTLVKTVVTGQTVTAG